MVDQQGHTNIKWLCSRYCWRNMVCQRSGWSSWTEDRIWRDFDSSRKLWTFGSLLCQRFWRTREETACKRKRIEISLVFVTIMLHVLTHVVFNKKIWNWNSVVRFVSQMVWLDKGFVIQNFCNCCLLQIVSLWSFSIGVGIIFTTNEIVYRKRNLKWNASPNYLLNILSFFWKECAAGQIFL